MNRNVHHPPGINPPPPIVLIPRPGPPPDGLIGIGPPQIPSPPPLPVAIRRSGLQQETFPVVPSNFFDDSIVNSWWYAPPNFRPRDMPLAFRSLRHRHEPLLITNGEEKSETNPIPPYLRSDSPRQRNPKRPRDSDSNESPEARVVRVRYPDSMEGSDGVGYPMDWDRAVIPYPLHVTASGSTPMDWRMIPRDNNLDLEAQPTRRSRDYAYTRYYNRTKYKRGPLSNAIQHPNAPQRFKRIIRTARDTLPVIFARIAARRQQNALNNPAIGPNAIPVSRYTGLGGHYYPPRRRRKYKRVYRKYRMY